MAGCVRCRSVGKVGLRIFAEEVPCRSIVEKGGGLCIGVVAEMEPCTIHPNAHVPLLYAAMPAHTLVAAGTESGLLAVLLVLIERDQAQIFMPAVEPIAVDMVDALAGLGVHDMAMEVDESLGPTLALEATCIPAANVEPLPLAEVCEIRFIDESGLAACEGYSFGHERGSCEAKAAEESQEACCARGEHSLLGVVG